MEKRDSEPLHIQPDETLPVHPVTSGESSTHIGEGPHGAEALEQLQISLQKAQAEAARSVGSIVKEMH